MKFLVLAAFFAILASNAYAAPDAEYLEYCSAEKFNKKYDDGGCWSCGVIFMLMDAMTKISGTIFAATMELCLLILNWGVAIWLAVYFLKSVSAFATQDAAKVIDGVLTFMFKWALVYTLVAAGISEIVENIVNPLLGIGFDVGKTFMDNAGI